MDSFKENGYAIACQLLKQEEIKFIKTEINKAITCNSNYGIRNLDKKVLAIKTLANSAKISDLVTNYLGSSPKLIRAIYFNKTQNNNWFVPWHHRVSSSNLV